MLYVDHLALVGERAVAGDDEEPADARKIGGQALGHAVNRDQVRAAGAKLLVKQSGSNHALWPGVTGKGEDPAQWPADLRVQEFPQ